MSQQQVDLDILIEEVRAALAEGNWRRAVALIEALRPPDQAELFSELPPEEQDVLLPRLDVEDSADILEELEDAEAARIASRLEARDLARILDEMEPDEAADLLGDLAPEQAIQALASMTEVEEVGPLLAYPDDSAGGRMVPPPVVLRQDMTAEEAIAHLRAVAPDSETAYYLFVVDEGNRLVGVVSLRQLIVAPPWRRIREIMDPHVIHIHARADQEEAARLMARYGLLALPVVDDEGRLLGMITHDDLVGVLEEETTEDIYRLSASEPLDMPYVDTPILTMFRKRVGWLLLLFVTETLTGTVLRYFEKELSEAIALTFFVPLLIGTGGNAGGQVSSAIVRALALGEIRFRDIAMVVWREIRTALLLGMVMGVAGFIRAMTWHSPPLLSLTVGTTLCAIVLWAALIGAILPLIAHRLRIDPAVVSGPAMTTLVDATGLVIYFLIARAIMGL
ncbi:MAG: magnesium transporter [Anaerolineae bacterium]|nr:magnesium transporter [Anaerolineae bacterium]MCX8067410.1 magnesium transporter [Anaerolineae bacterium]MDW7992300.1 magnesium transporter [Anaerolineae bacterium]